MMDQVVKAQLTLDRFGTPLVVIESSLGNGMEVSPERLRQLAVTLLEIALMAEKRVDDLPGKQFMPATVECLVGERDEGQMAYAAEIARRQRAGKCSEESGVPQRFDGEQWRVRCESMAAVAAKACGLSHGLYVDRFSAAVDEAVAGLPESCRQQAYEVARSFDYATVEERDEEQRWNAEHGYCSHGIELGCCPAGCGSD